MCVNEWALSSVHLLQAQLGAATSRGAIVALKGSLSQTATLSGIAGVVTAMATIFKPNWAPWSAPLYAAFKGAVLGALSFQFEAMFPGLVQNAVLVTFGTAGTLPNPQCIPDCHCCKEVPAM